MTEALQQKVKNAQENGLLSEVAAGNVLNWCGPEFANFHAELTQLVESENWKDLEDRFYRIIPFGTGGRRGERGLGTNRINLRTIGESAQGLATYILENAQDGADKGVVISHDTRHQSREFAEECACILAGNGIKAYLFEDFRSTPQLSFAIRHLGTVAGIMISASHNPPADNGIKVSWMDGGQVLPPHDKGIISKVVKVTTIQRTPMKEALDSGKITIVGSDIDEAYQAANLKLSMSDSRAANLVYTALHGVGGTNVLELLKRADFVVHAVEKQMVPDPDFSTVPNQLPNPEFPEALEMAIELGKEVRADLVMASDPDSDRLGAAIPVPEWLSESGWLALNGNQIGVLAAAYLLKKLKEKEQLPDAPLVVKTCVTTEMIAALANEYSIPVIGNLLVGFKYIAEVIENSDNPENFVFGMEESHGYLAGSWVRDKDAAHAGILLSEYASELKDGGSSMFQGLLELYRRLGVFMEHQVSVMFPGKEGAEKMAAMMNTLREKPPTEIAGKKVLRVIDRLSGEGFSPSSPQDRLPVEGTKGNVLILEFSEDGRNRLTMRPSGTEPKIKNYAQFHSAVPENATAEEVFGMITQLREDATKLIGQLRGLVE